MHTMWLMKFNIPMYFMIVDFSCNNETFIAKFFIVIIWRVDSCSINIFIYFYNNIITCEKILFCRNKYGGVQVATQTPGFIYNRPHLKNIYTIFSFTPFKVIHFVIPKTRTYNIIFSFLKIIRFIMPKIRTHKIAFS